MKRYIVYKYTSPSGKVYIGQTKNEKERKRRHIYDSLKGIETAFCRAIRKYGFESFSYEVIVRDVPDYMIDAFERYWIHFYNSCHGEGYNAEEGGFRATINQDTKDRISKTLTGTKQSQKTKDLRNSKLLGQKRNKEQIYNYRKGQKKYYIPVLCVETGKVYESIAEAQRALGVEKSHIGNVCTGRRKSSLGYTWKYIKNIGVSR